MGESRSLTLIFLVVTVVLSLLLNISYVEARRGSSRGSRYTRRTNYTGSNGGSNGALSRGNDPLPWWAITLIFVLGVLGLFISVMCFRRFYEKKRQQKIQSMLRRRSLNWAERRRTTEENRSNTTSGVPQGSPVAPPSYEQSAMDDARPPAYSKDVNTEDEHTMPPPPTPVDTCTSVPMDTTPPAAPPSYDVAQNDGSEVVEVGGVATMD